MDQIPESLPEDITSLPSNTSIVSQQNTDRYLDVPEEAVYYFFIDNKKRKLIDAAHLTGQRKKTSKVWAHGINAVDVETKKKYWLCKICMLS